jgi:hypothetical protein
LSGRALAREGPGSTKLDLDTASLRDHVLDHGDEVLAQVE